MTNHARAAMRSGLRVTAVGATLALLAACGHHGRIQDHAIAVQTRYLGQPAAQAIADLGAPRVTEPRADLRSHFWETGVDGRPGGNCLLELVADARGVIVDYTLRGTPLGCERLLRKG